MKLGPLIDLGVPAGLALYCVFEFAETGSFGWQKAATDFSAAGLEAAMLLGLASGVLAVLWFLIGPAEWLGGIGRDRDDLDERITAAYELRGRDLPSILWSEIKNCAVAAGGIAAAGSVMVLPLTRYFPEVLGDLWIAGLAIFCLYVWSRIAHIQRLRRLMRVPALPT